MFPWAVWMTLCSSWCRHKISVTPDDNRYQCMFVFQYISCFFLLTKPIPSQPSFCCLLPPRYPHSSLLRSSASLKPTGQDRWLPIYSRTGSTFLPFPLHSVSSPHKAPKPTSLGVRPWSLLRSCTAWTLLTFSISHFSSLRKGHFFITCTRHCVFFSHTVTCANYRSGIKCGGCLARLQESNCTEFSFRTAAV